MTRKEQIEQAAYSRYCNDSSITFTLQCNCFKDGANWAYEHPQNNIKEDLDLITQWLEHIAQIADDRKTFNGYVMEEWKSLDEISALAKNSAEYIKNHLI